MIKQEYALVIGTNETLQVISRYKEGMVSMSINLGDLNDYPKSNYLPRNEKFRLSDGNVYDKNKLIIGLSSIREYKIKNLIN